MFNKTITKLNEIYKKSLKNDLDINYIVELKTIQILIKEIFKPRKKSKNQNNLSNLLTKTLTKKVNYERKKQMEK